MSSRKYPATRLLERTYQDPLDHAAVHISHLLQYLRPPQFRPTHCFPNNHLNDLEFVDLLTRISLTYEYIALHFGLPDIEAQKLRDDCYNFHESYYIDQSHITHCQRDGALARFKHSFRSWYTKLIDMSPQEAQGEIRHKAAFFNRCQTEGTDQVIRKDFGITKEQLLFLELNPVPMGFWDTEEGKDIYLPERWKSEADTQQEGSDADTQQEGGPQ